MADKNRYVIHIPFMCYRVVESLIASFLTSLHIVPSKKQLLEAAIRFYPELPARKQKLYYSTFNASKFKDGYKTIRVSKETHSKAHKLAKRFGLSCSMFAAVALYSYYISITNSTISEK
jgi:hypothetical protein